MMNFKDSLEFAQALDRDDVLKEFRSKFLFPEHNGSRAIYFCGNSLGLQPAHAKNYVNQELKDWAELGVEGHFMAKSPWVSYHKQLTAQLSMLCGALPEEVVAMNSLTVNLHLLLVSFFRPDNKRHKIIIEDHSFSSDIYAIKSQLAFHSLDLSESLIVVSPRKGSDCLETEDIIATIEAHADELALVLFSGVNFYSGQLFDIDAITKAAHKAGAYAGFDLAHAIGNVELKLHDWGVDFAVWCSYKYLNSGPGGTGGAFVHSRHHQSDSKIPRFEGWWGAREEDRFLMKEDFAPAEGIEAWQLSNAPVLSMAAQRASLDLFQAAGLEPLFLKSKVLTAYLEFFIRSASSKDAEAFKIKIITPGNPMERGCQLSVKVSEQADKLFAILTENNIMADMRRPDVIRLAPVPLYNSFQEVYNVGQVIKNHCHYEHS
jgi:kynureninase